MNADIQARFDRLDAALSTLVDSLTSYNPSTAAAAALISADDHLTEGLELLTQHQRNHQHILSLRATAQSLDDRVKSTLLILAQTRKDLLNPVAPPEAPTKYEINHEQLLRYAQNIARFTVPPTNQPALPPSITAPTQQTESSDQQTSTLTTTPLENGRAADSGTAAASTPLESSHLVQAPRDQGKAIASLPAAVKAWLEPASSQMPFLPWPEDSTIRTGALGQIEDAWTKGLDPGSRDLAAEAEAEAEAAKQQQEEN